jgi:hypothetical protein
MFILRNILFMFLCVLIGAAVAATNGILGNSIVNWFIDFLKVEPEKALGLFVSFTTLLSVVIRFILKKVPSKTSGIIGFALWHAAAFLFGDGVKLENNTDMKYVKEELKKKYPLLNIEIPK